MKTQNCTRSSAIVAALVSSLFTSSSLADFEVCNQTGETLFILAVVPEPGCASREIWDRYLLADASCLTIYAGSAKGKNIKIRAWSQDPVGDRAWGGDIDVWVPNQANSDEDYCMPTIACRVSHGESSSCPAGRSYRMDEYVPEDANMRIRLR